MDMNFGGDALQPITTGTHQKVYCVPGTAPSTGSSVQMQAWLCPSRTCSLERKTVMKTSHGYGLQPLGCGPLSRPFHSRSCHRCHAQVSDYHTQGQCTPGPFTFAPSPMELGSCASSCLPMQLTPLRVLGPDPEPLPDHLDTVAFSPVKGGLCMGKAPYLV